MPPARKGRHAKPSREDPRLARSVSPASRPPSTGAVRFTTTNAFAVRAELHRARLTNHGDLDDFDDDATGVDLTKHEISEMVLERRDADKSGPLLRWAEHHADNNPALRDATINDCLEHFASRSPDGVIGHHAIEHIAWGIYRVCQ